MTLGKYLKFVFLVISINLLLSVAISYLSYYYLKGILSNNAIIWDSTIEEAIVTILLVPIFETLIFQYYSYKIFLYITKDVTLTDSNKDWLFIICSSLVFSFMHSYNWLYRVNAFLGGITLNYSYLYFKKAKFYPYLSVVLIHLLYNLCVFLLKKYLA
ncbi:CPBP family glutamic-type intramembrane protease [Niabella yanshanensis]